MSFTRALIPVFLLGIVFAGYHAAAGEKVVVVVAAPTALVAKGEAPELTATAYAIFDTTTGAIIVSQNGDAAAPIASVTKLVTAAAVLDTLDQAAAVVVTAADVDTYGEAGRLSVGEAYTHQELLFPLLLESSNDAAAVYERSSEGEVVAAMNQLVQKIGVDKTSFHDASGLSAKNVATAHELATVTQFLYTNYTHIFDITRLKNQAGPYVGWTNNNPVQGAGYVGGKHGYIEAAGRTVVALYEEQITPQQKNTIGYVVLGSDNLVSDLAVLRDFVTTAVVGE